ncbi:hypothetical protein HO173_003359 [Letharia columbiana]|uniref:DUF6593 domain-containing protein n=1 Tax=Letharia columbiana TaxID=112416 RepID=A0A8H6L7H1_9LECA|nr:uncharacterized protein HO173_003359 [Letharia columbiana]KAF6238392.1 hypothetical protein HO173_003359 [Letharia columbiana]
MSQAVTKELPSTGLPPTRYPNNMRGQIVPYGQPALAHTGSPPSLYPNNIGGQAVPQAQPATPYEGTPPYTENPRWTAPLPSTGAPPYTFSPASTAAPPSYTASADPPSSSRLLHVYHSGMTHHNTQILGPDKVTVLYTVKMNTGGLFGSMPDVIVYKANTGTVVGTATFHSFSRDIEMVIHNNPIALSASSIFTSAHEWTSLATTTDGRRMCFKWKSDNLFNGGDMICLDQHDKVCARYENSMWALQKDGKFELVPFVSGVLADEVVVTGLTMLEARRRRSRSS